MLSTLDWLREKPKAYRIRFSIIAAAIITAGIVWLWLAVPYPIPASDNDNEAGIRRDSGVPTPFATIGESLSTFYIESAAQFKALRSFIDEARSAAPE